MTSSHLPDKPCFHCFVISAANEWLARGDLDTLHYMRALGECAADVIAANPDRGQRRSLTKDFSRELPEAVTFKVSQRLAAGRYGREGHA